MTHPLTVSAVMASDWHVGSGEGATKQVDRAVVRDAAGLPYLPAKTLTGVLRERAEQVADSLDADQPDDHWAEWVRWLFGSRPDRSTAKSDDHRRETPIPAALMTAPLRITESVRADEVADLLDVHPDELRRAATVLRTNVAIDRTTGTAADDQLRTDERARAGLRLDGTWALATDRPLRDVWPAVFLLQAAARLTAAVGGKRRRGAGELTLTLTAPGARDFDALAASAIADAPPMPPAAPAAAGTSAADLPHGPLRHALTAWITTRSPLLVGATTRGNTVTSSTTIPGAALLPLVTEALGLDFTAVRDGRVVVTPATPVIGDERTVPWPMTLTREKGRTSGEVVNGLCVHTFDPKHKPARDHYVAAFDDCWASTKPALTQRMHVSVHEDRDSEVFTYEAVAPGTGFAAEVWLPEGHRVRLDSLPTQARIGQSRKDDYGDVRIRWTAAEKRRAPDAIEAGAEFSVFLESDVLLRGPSGGPDPTVEGLLRALGARLGVELTEAEAIREPAAEGERGERVSVTRAVNTVRIDSWQTRWGLPRPSLIGLAAGGVIQVKTDGEITAEKLESLHVGVGERTAEGFGRIRIADPLLQDPHPTFDVAPAAREPGSAQRTLAADTRQVMVEAVLSGRVSRAVDALVADPDRRRRWIPSSASRAQKGVLRRLALGLGTKRGVDAFDHWYSGTQTIQTRRAVWEETAKRLKAVVDSIPSDEHGDHFWDLLDADGDGRRFRVLLDQIPEESRARWAREAFQLLLVELTRDTTKEKSA
ncbi:MAG: RAMP superfamily CRISPR-associated protein [Gordonia sp. (in: high G+C Gram-positive bacteria)]|uniref:RAMP superfamily CRISPR-associated protein n=1 Tax=Gordonia sp. (in: high G+C Gram-positive bacteria) TaxID=84139 RepID=UPI0039E67672